MIPEGKYINRDLSWLSFNYRVLLEASDDSLPIYERLKFLAIYSSNMGEFYRVRVASIQRLLQLSKKISPDEKEKLKANEALLEAIHKEVFRQQETFGSIFHQQVLPKLAEHKIVLLLDTPSYIAHQEFVRNFFDEEITPYLHPELLRKNKILHFLRDTTLYLAVKLRNRPRNYEQLLPAEKLILAEKKRVRYALIQIPTHYFPRFIELPSIDGVRYYAFLDDVIRYNLERVFHGYDVLSSHSVKLNRNADLMIEDEDNGNLVKKVANSLKKRRVGLPSRFLYDQEMPSVMLKYLRDTFELKKRELVPGGRYHSFFDFFGFPNPHAPELEREPTPPLPVTEFGLYANIFAALQVKSWLLHFPYHSYDHVISFLNQAAVDAQVKEIYATQYRVASHSQVVSALIRAAQNGKKVTVFVEIKARFDEASNLKSAQEMEEAGVKTIYSIPGLKVHAKVAMVLRQEADGTEKGYAFLSTGNFNEKTARIYTDQGYLTSRSEIIRELKELFAHLVDRTYIPKAFQTLLVAQFGMRERFAEMLRFEMQEAQAGRPSGIFIKLNNLEDRKMIDFLYEASQAGVEVRLVVRGICCLRPGVPGLSENITVRRIVDQFLEHSRIFIFHNAGNETYYLGSADWMRRNLNRRIEVAFPIVEPNLQAELKELMNIQWADNVKAVTLNENLENIAIENDQPPIRTQLEIYERVKQGLLGKNPSSPPIPLLLPSHS
ncbi:MAG: polyphosphate kinase 1 [Bacteroidota bacterium]